MTMTVNDFFDERNVPIIEHLATFNGAKPEDLALCFWQQGITDEHLDMLCITPPTPE